MKYIYTCIFIYLSVYLYIHVCMCVYDASISGTAVIWIHAGAAEMELCVLTLPLFSPTFRRRRRGEKKNFISGRLSAQTAGGSRFSADSWLRFREEEQGEREEGEGRAAAERSREEQRGRSSREEQRGRSEHGGREEEEQSERREAEGRAAGEGDHGKQDGHKLAGHRRTSSASAGGAWRRSG